jgi:hypothetical protein
MQCLPGIGAKIHVSAMHAIPNASDILLSEAPDVLLTDVVLEGGMEARKRINDSGAPLLAKPSTLSQLERALNAVMLRSPQDTSRS